MFCSNCGTELPNEAAFCWKCGHPQKHPDEVQYEIADVKFFDRLYGICYEARHGKTLIAQSSPTIVSRRQANQDVVARLAAKGWEPYQKDESGYVISMRRALPKEAK